MDVCYAKRCVLEWSYMMSDENQSANCLGWLAGYLPRTKGAFPALALVYLTNNINMEKIRIEKHTPWLPRPTCWP